MAPSRNLKTYTEDAISDCINSINAGKTLYAACKEFGIPMSTIRYRISGNWRNKFKPGPQSVLSADEKQNIADWLNEMQDRGFPVTRRVLLFKLKEFLAELAEANPDRVTPFRNNKPGKKRMSQCLNTNNLQYLLTSGRKWLRGFMRRNNSFSFRMPEALSSASSRVSEKDIRGSFNLIDGWLTENGMREILNDPARIFNADETSFFLHPKSKEVIARTGSRNVYEAEQAAAEHNVTVMFAFGAILLYILPILPGKRLRYCQVNV